MPKRPVARSAEVRAAVITALLAGQSVSQVAKEYNLPKGTVSSWKTRTAEGITSPNAKPANVNAASASGATQKESIGDLLVDLVRENIKGLIAGAQLLQDAKWLRSQGAAELGTILSITNDKTIRMLEAMDRSANSSPTPEPAT